MPPVFMFTKPQCAHSQLQTLPISLRNTWKGLNIFLSSTGGPWCIALFVVFIHMPLAIHGCATGEINAGSKEWYESVLLLFCQVTAFCDVDEKKITRGFYTFEESEVGYKYFCINYCDLKSFWKM